MTDEIMVLTKRGYRIVSQTDDQAMVVHGHRPTHILYLLLSVFTLGLRLPLWLLLACTVRERYKLSTVDALGNVRSTR